MGNSCSFGQGRKGSDSISDKSDESKQHEAEPEKMAQDAPRSNIIGEPPQVTPSVDTSAVKIAPKALQEISNICGDTVSTPSPVVKEFGTKLENVIEIDQLPPKLQDMDPLQVLLLRGKLGNDKYKRKSKKIVLYVLSADASESVQERYELSDNILHKLREKFSKQDFEIILTDLGCVDNNPRLLSEIKKWDLKKQADISYVVPILLLNNTFGDQLLPYAIQVDDFDEALTKLQDKNKDLLKALYVQNGGAYKLQANASNAEVQELLKDLTTAWSQEKVLKYCTTSLEDILNDLIKEQDLIKNLVWLSRTGTTPFSADTEVHKKLSNLVQELKKLVPEKNILKHQPKPSDNKDTSTLIQQISAQLFTALTNAISSLIQDHNQSSLAKPSFGLSSRLFSMIEHQIPDNFDKSSDLDDVAKILDYLKNDSKKVLAVCGPQFCGKTSLLKIICRKVMDGDVWPNDGNFICKLDEQVLNGCMVKVLEDIADQCKVLDDGEETSCKHDIQSYSSIISATLTNTKKPLLLIVDGLDRFEPLDVSWIPQTLTKNVKIVVSVSSKNLLDKLEQKCVIQIGEDSTRRLLAGVFASEYLNTNATEFIKSDDKVQVLSKYINDISKEFGDFDVLKVLALFAASRHGLLESEVLDILTGCDNLKRGTQKQSYASACTFWTKLYKRMEPFFLNKRDCISFRNQLLKQSILSDNIKLGHQVLFDYFTQLKTDIDIKPFISRKHLEVPHHYYNINGADSFINSEYLISTDWIYKKLLYCQTDALLEDINLVTSSSSQHLIVLKEFLITNKKSLDYDSRQFYSLLHIYFENKQDFTNMNGVHGGKVEVKRKFSNNVVQTWYDACKKPPVCSLVVQNLDDLLESESKNEVVFNSLQRLGNGDLGYVTSLSTQREEICVWDVNKCKRVRTLTGVTQPLSLCPVDDNRCIVLCGRELRLFNLDLGSSLVKLKGVMNQKMPFYGLHDNGHVVCLSRNRMYVNLMNLESGDCVTTFKAGEDRFLNSLLVSGDGRILVCGDETQKPFPLLVWHLTSRKLLYDLRIPHHDFVTSLAAITFEGNYVCVVCRETTEPSPNFIVVYDLQSGTLFKKWKPLCDTVALEISSADGSVVSGLQDARILVWDLITGNCRHTLIGHTAPVTSLRLDPSGGILLSSDSMCRDRSIRLWDLNNGSMLAVFTPTAKITSCEIIQKGRYITLALEDHKNLVVLKLVRPEDDLEDNTTTVQYYGLQENDGKVFNLKEGAP